jgi:hypothetical protein
MHMLPNSRTMGTPYYPGLGDVTTAAIGAGVTGATTGLTIAAGAAAIPVAGAIIAAGAALYSLITAIINNSGCGQTCVISSNDANNVQAALLANLRAYTSLPVRTQSDQAQALANFDYAWGQLNQMCSNPQLGDAGKRCISDRQAGACTWKTTQGGWTQNNDGSCSWTDFGPAGSGDVCWNWFSGFRDPIANDPCVVPDSVASAASGTGSSITSGVNTLAASLGLNSTTLLLIAAGAVLLLGSTGGRH